MTTHRTPYVGTGEDGARRCAERERDQARDLSWSDPRRQNWKTRLAVGGQATELMRERMGPKPTLEEVRDSTGNESMLAALALAEGVPRAPRT